MSPGQDLPMDAVVKLFKPGEKISARGAPVILHVPAEGKSFDLDVALP